MSREIIVAAKDGGDPNANFRLRQAVDRAKAEGVPNDNIQRAIEKGSGSGSAANLEELTYEGYGPGGVAMLVQCATDNRNRTAGDIRSFFSKYGGNLGETGCVGWMFKEQGQLTLAKTPNLSEEDLLSTAADHGADDIDTSEAESVTVTCAPQSIEELRNALSKNGYKITSAEISMVPSSTVEVTEKEIAKQLLRLLDSIENQDDVQHVYANFDMDPKWMQEFLT
jgi:YebC/PmpR family DNA-binding regulatory protein